MTALVGVLNKSGIALAADSAISGLRGTGENVVTGNYGVKLLPLSNCRPVGVMYCGSEEVAGIDWVSATKQYREQLGDKAFGTLAEYGQDFTNYITGKLLTKELLAGFMYTVSDKLLHTFNWRVHETLFEHGHPDQVSATELKSIHLHCINELKEPWYKGKAASVLVKQEKDLCAAVRAAVEERTKGLHVDESIRDKLVSLCLFNALNIAPGAEGNYCVVAGFGEDEQLPSALVFSPKSIVGGRLTIELTHRDQLNQRCDGIIAPFAMEHETVCFFKGIHGKVLRELLDRAEDMATEGVLEWVIKPILEKVPPKSQAVIRETVERRLADIGVAFSKRLGEVIEDIALFNISRPLINAVRMMGPPEMATLAETLVNLEAVRLRMTNEAMVVGGPIDVAVITKGDGFVWIKHKEYFPAELNPQYFYNYNRKVVQPRQETVTTAGPTAVTAALKTPAVRNGKPRPVAAPRKRSGPGAGKLPLPKA